MYRFVYLVPLLVMGRSRPHKRDVFAAYLSNEARTLLKALLQREPARRAGYGPQGSREVQKSPFFKGINWRKLEEGLVLSPFKPVIKNDDSVENFDKIWTDLVRS